VNTGADTCVICSPTTVWQRGSAKPILQLMRRAPLLHLWAAFLLLPIS